MRVIVNKNGHYYMKVCKDLKENNYTLIIIYCTEKTLSTSPITSQLNVTAKSFVPEIQKGKKLLRIIIILSVTLIFTAGVHKVCKICLNSSDDESLLINKCRNHVTHSPVQLTCVAQDPNSRKLIPIRPRPLCNIKGDFQLCDMKRCKGDHCTHAHSKLECNAWNCDLKKGKLVILCDK